MSGEASKEVRRCCAGTVTYEVEERFGFKVWRTVIHHMKSCATQR